MNYGDNVRKLRNRLGLTQLELAKKLKITQVTVSTYETNTRLVSPPIVKKLLTLAKKENITIQYEDIRPE